MERATPLFTVAIVISVLGCVAPPEPRSGPELCNRTQGPGLQSEFAKVRFRRHGHRCGNDRRRREDIRNRVDASQS